MHWAQGSFDQNQGLQMLNRLHNAGTPVPCVLALAVPGCVGPNLLKSASPNTTVISRLIEGANYNGVPDKPLASLTYQDGYDWFEHLYWTKISVDSEQQAADIHALYNEWNIPDSAHTAVNEFNRGAMDAAYSRHRRITIYNFNPGFPPLPNELEKPWHDFWTRPSTIANLRQAKAQSHVVALHAYDLFNAGNWTGQWDCLRHRKIQALLPSDLRTGLDWYITEFGDALLMNVGDDIFLQRVRAAQAELTKDAYIRGVCIWTFGISSEMWRESNAAPHLLSYEGFLRNG